MNTWKINKNDISYRFLNRWCDWIPRDFCGYYRKVTLVALGLFALAFLIGNALMAPVYYLFGVGLFNDHITTIQEVLYVISFYEWIFAIALGGTFLAYYVKDKVEDWKDSKAYDADGNYIGRKEKNPSIIKMWYKAKKEKFCPLIEFEDDNTEDLTGND